MVTTGVAAQARVDDNQSARQRNTRRLARRRTRFISNVQKDLGGIEIGQTPSLWLVAWGLGLGSGTPKDDIVSIFLNPEEIRYFRDKTYCLLLYRDVIQATEIKERLEQEFFDLSLQVNGPKRFIGFLSGEPPAEDLSLISSFFTSPPPGLRIIPDFVTPDQEKLILIKLRQSKNSSSVERTLKHRWVKHFGYEFRYGSNDVDATSPLVDDPIPPYLSSVAECLVQSEFFEKLPEQCTVNEYDVGHGIPPHVDTHSCFEGPIVSLSLGSEIVMNFRRGQDNFSLALEPRSLLVLEGDVRHGWTHGIANRSYDIVPTPSGKELDALPRQTRTSLTFRALRKVPICNCSFPEMCDSQKAKISEDNARKLEDNLVHEVYERIAPHFNETRHTPWPQVKEFLLSLPSGSIVLDVGCGNGKYFNINKDLVQIGSDMSLGLLEICRENKKAEVLRANALQLPFCDCSFGAVICIAVLHHISTKERRSAAISELLRILSPGGEGLVYVWSKDQHVESSGSVYASKSNKSSASKAELDLTDVKEALPDFAFLPVHEKDSASNFVQNDVLVPWVNVRDVSHRYYHVFNEGELEELISQYEEAKIMQSYHEQGNWVVRFCKVEK